jgi:biotin synthase
MGAAWRQLHDKDTPKITAMIKGVKAMGLETCMTLGMLKKEQAVSLKEAGLDYYNHNLDSSESFYKTIISTRTYEERLNTIEHVREAGINVCCGGILGMGETSSDRVSLLHTLATMPTHPESVPINQLIQIGGTPLETSDALDAFDFIRTIAVARILMPLSYVRLSAGRENMSEQTQALCFLAGANSIFYGEKLLTASNPSENHDKILFEKLGLRIEAPKHCTSPSLNQLDVQSASA